MAARELFGPVHPVEPPPEPLVNQDETEVLAYVMMNLPGDSFTSSSSNESSSDLERKKIHSEEGSHQLTHHQVIVEEMIKKGEEQELIEGMIKSMNELNLSSHDEIFRVNIGGKVFHIASSLLSIKEDEMLAKICRSNNKNDENYFTI